MNHKLIVIFGNNTSALLNGGKLFNLIQGQLIAFPENSLHKRNTKSFIDKLRSRKIRRETEPDDLTVVTNSLFVLREIMLSKIDAEYICVTQNGKDIKIERSFDIDDIKNIEVLDMDLEQSERYMNAVNRLEI